MSTRNQTTSRPSDTRPEIANTARTTRCAGVLDPTIRRADSTAARAPPRGRQPAAEQDRDDRDRRVAAGRNQKRGLDAEPRDQKQSRRQAAGDRTGRVGRVQHADPGAHACAPNNEDFTTSGSVAPISAEGTMRTANDIDSRTRTSVDSDARRTRERRRRPAAASRASPASRAPSDRSAPPRRRARPAGA